MTQFRVVGKINREVKKHPLNAEGKYYVEQNSCYWCAICVNTAPNNFRLEDSNYEFGAYVFKQPENSEEEKQCRDAINYCPHEAILENGEE